MSFKQYVRDGTEFSSMKYPPFSKSAVGNGLFYKRRTKTAELVRIILGEQRFAVNSIATFPTKNICKSKNIDIRQRVIWIVWIEYIYHAIDFKNSLSTVKFQLIRSDGEFGR